MVIHGSFLSSVRMASLAISAYMFVVRLASECPNIVLTVANGEIVRFQMLEDSFAVSQAAHG